MIERNLIACASCTALVDFLQRKLCSTDTANQLFACKCCHKLCVGKSNREALLSANQFVQLLVDLVSRVLNIDKMEHLDDEDRARVSVINKTKGRVLRECLRALYFLSKGSTAAKQILLQPTTIKYFAYFLKFEELKAQKLVLKFFTSLFDWDATDVQLLEPMFQALCSFGAVEILFSFLKSSHRDLQMESLNLFCHFSSLEQARAEIFNKGVFHTFLWLVRSENPQIQKIALKALTYFTPSENIQVDALLLKYGLDVFIKLCGEEDDVNNDTLVFAFKLLAHLSEYNRIHSILLQLNILLKAFKILSTPEINRTYFHCLLLLSNLSKFKEGQMEIFKQGGLDSVFKSMQLISVVSKLDKVSIGAREVELLPKIITRIIANMSGCHECQSIIASDSPLQTMAKLITMSTDRTVVWNTLCSISNICDTNAKKVLRCADVRKLLTQFLTQVADTKLQNRSMRCLGVMSKNCTYFIAYILLFSERAGRIIVLFLLFVYHQSEHRTKQQ